MCDSGTADGSLRFRSRKVGDAARGSHAQRSLYAISGVGREPLANLLGGDERELVQFFDLQHDLIWVVDHSTVKDESDPPAALIAWSHPVDNEKPADDHIKAEFLSHLPLAADMRRFVSGEDSTGDVPPRTVVLLHQQHSAQCIGQYCAG